MFSPDRSESGTVWFYPFVAGDDDVVADVAASSNPEAAKLARWHHGGRIGENFGGDWYGRRGGGVFFLARARAVGKNQSVVPRRR